MSGHGFLRGEKGAMERPIDFERFAAECARLAHAVESIEDKAQLLRMAEVWIRLADKAERIHAVLGDFQ